MNFRVVILFYFLKLPLATSKDVKEYCEHLHCDGEINVICGRSYLSCKTSEKCGVIAQERPLSKCERQAILEYHNEARHRFASTHDKRMKETIADMNTLSYSLELEYSAQCTTNSCSNLRSRCSRTPNFEYVYQNVYTGRFHGRSYKDLEDVVHAWFQETLPAGGANATANITNQIWAKATHIGCSRTAYGESPIIILVFYACNYGSNKDKKDAAKLYTVGKPCTQCGIQKCSMKYRSLCGEEHIFEKYDNPFPLTSHGTIISVNVKCLFLNYIMLFLLIYIRV